MSMKRLLLAFSAPLVILAALSGPSNARESAAQIPDTQAEKTEESKEIVPFRSDSPIIPLTMRQATAPLEVATIFYKKIGREPDFKRWVEAGKPYQQALEIDRKEIFLQEYNKMVKAFNEMNPDSLVTVVSKIDLGEYSSLQSIQKVNNFDSEAFFKFDAAGDYFAIIPKNLAQFQYLYLQQERRDMMMSHTGGGGSLVAEIALNIERVDATEPLEIAGYPFWLMLGEIVSLRIWSPSEDNRKLLWLYQNDKYDLNEDSEILNLYQDKN